MFCLGHKSADDPYKIVPLGALPRRGTMQPSANRNRQPVFQTGECGFESHWLYQTCRFPPSRLTRTGQELKSRWKNYGGVVKLGSR